MSSAASLNFGQSQNEVSGNGLLLRVTSFATCLMPVNTGCGGYTKTEIKSLEALNLLQYGICHGIQFNPLPEDKF